jgi:hypothetical protein
MSLPRGLKSFRFRKNGLADETEGTEKRCPGWGRLYNLVSRSTG